MVCQHGQTHEKSCGLKNRHRGLASGSAIRRPKAERKANGHLTGSVIKIFLVVAVAALAVGIHELTTPGGWAIGWPVGAVFARFVPDQKNARERDSEV